MCSIIGRILFMMPRSKSIFTLSFDLLAYFDKASITANKVAFSLDCNSNIVDSTSLASERDERNGLYFNSASFSSSSCSPRSSFLYKYHTIFYFRNKRLIYNFFRTGIFLYTIVSFDPNKEI